MATESPFYPSTRSPTAPSTIYDLRSTLNPNTNNGAWHRGRGQLALYPRIPLPKPPQSTPNLNRLTLSHTSKPSSRMALLAITPGNLN